jgi:uncharacterized protein (TIGR02996 family)
MEEGLLQALHADPADDTARLVLADWLEEQGDPRGELLRLHVALRQRLANADLSACEERVRTLLAAGVRPCVPLLTNSVGMQLALIPPGVFLMGSPDSEVERQRDEAPQHEVGISRPFYLGVYPVTQGQWQRVMGRWWQRLTGSNPSWFCASGGGKDEVRGLDTRDFPVECVSWEEAVAFCGKLSELPEERRAKRRYRLPTEAEWEYACRGGAPSSTPFHFGNSLCSSQANFDGNHPYGAVARGPFLQRPTEVGAYQVSNGFGLYDLHGNVWEWCADWYGEHYYAGSPRLDPPGPSEGSGRVVRGGSWSHSGQLCRSADRYGHAPGVRYAYIGFRVALVPSGLAR